MNYNRMDELKYILRVNNIYDWCISNLSVATELISRLIEFPANFVMFKHDGEHRFEFEFTIIESNESVSMNLYIYDDAITFKQKKND